MEYTFGDIIKQDDIKRYSISKGGKIKIYCDSFDRKNNKLIYYESNLILTKIRELNDI